MTIDFAQKDKLTSMERIGRLMASEPTDRVAFVPFTLGFNAKICGMDRGTYYRNPEAAFEAGLAFMKAYPWTNASPAYGWADQGLGSLGVRLSGRIMTNLLRHDLPAPSSPTRRK